MNLEWHKLYIILELTKIVKLDPGHVTPLWRHSEVIGKDAFFPIWWKCHQLSKLMWFHGIQCLATNQLDK